MEENNFLDYNPQFNGNYANGVPFQENVPNPDYIGAKMSGSEDGALKRWMYPGLAEAAQFDKENFFVDKENAFNEYMFNKANAYNSAAQQMQRGDEAGINKNLLAAGIAGMGGNTAQPMQGARGDVGMNTNNVNPIEQMGHIASAVTNTTNAVDTLGNIFGFGKKNTAEIKAIKATAAKTAEEMKYTRRQRIQLEQIGEILVENERQRGKEIEANINQLKELARQYQAAQENLKEDTLLKEAQVGQTLEETKSIKYDNWRKEFEKVFRDTFGVELTHGQIQMLVEALMSGKGDKIIAFLEDTLASVIKGVKESFKINGNPINDYFSNLGKETRNDIKNWIGGFGQTAYEYVMNKVKATHKSWNYSNIHTEYCNAWDMMPENAQQELKKLGYNKYTWADRETKKALNGGYSGRWED